MSVEQIGRSSVIAYAGRIGALDPLAVLTMMRHERINQMQSKLEGDVGKLEALIGQREKFGRALQVLGELKGELAKDSGSGAYLAKTMIDFLRSERAAEIMPALGELSFNKAKNKHECLAIREAQIPTIEFFESSGGAAVSDLDVKINELKSSVRELSQSLDYEMKSMQRSVRSAASHGQAMVR